MISFRRPKLLVGNAFGFCLISSLAFAEDAFDQRWLGSADWPVSALAYAKPAAQIPDPFAGAIKPPVSGLPAESGVNYSLSGYGGYTNLGHGLGSQAIGGSNGSVAFPIGHSFGFLTNLTAGSIGNNSIYDAAPDLYWRDPNTGLVGVGGHIGHFSNFGGETYGSVGGNLESYSGRFTPFATSGAFGGQNLKTKGYATLGTAYYPTDNLQLTLSGYNFSGFGGVHGGVEYLLPRYNNAPATTVSLDGVVGSHGTSGTMAKLTFLFGPTATNNKTLIERRRQDDPLTIEQDLTLNGFYPGDTTLNGFALAIAHRPGGTNYKQCTDGENVSDGCACPGSAEILGGQCSYLGPSDLRLKRDIVEVSQLDNGIRLYRYHYVWSDQLYVGVLAQEVEKVFPDAVYHAADGYLRVIYSRLAFPLMTWEEWTALGGSSVTKSCQAPPQVAKSDGHVSAAVTVALLAAEVDNIVPARAE